MATLALPAAAHEANPGVRVTLDTPPAQLAGIEVAVVRSVTDQLLLRNPTQRIVEVLDDDGQPFLRIGRGRVEANRNAPAWYLTNNPLGSGQVPPDVRPGAKPRWAVVSAEPSWGWFDHRLHPPGLQVSDALRAAGQPAEIGRWQVPLRTDGDEVTLRGTIRFEPVLGAVISRLTRQPKTRGVVLTTLPGRIPGMFLDNTSRQTVVVFGAHGEPFLRFTRKGVEANRHSPSWLEARRAEAGDVPARLADPKRPPSWTRVSSAPRFGWIEPRTGYAPGEPPADVKAAGVARTLGRWSIPLRIGGRKVRAAGVVSWQPIAQPAHPAGEPNLLADWAVVLATLAVIGAGTAAVVVLRRRRLP